MTEENTPKRASRKKIQADLEPEGAVRIDPEIEPEPVEAEVSVETEDEKPTVLAASLVRNNEVARNSQSVKDVQDELTKRGYWNVKADPAGYWGRFTQDAAVAETGEDDPVAAARALGFTVI